MGYAHDTVITDLDALMAALDAFAGAEGWNVEDDGFPGTRNVRCYHRDGCYSSLRKPSSGSMQYLGQYQSLGYVSGSHESPWLYTRDDGGGPEGTINTTTRRYTDLMSAGPYPAYWMFSPDSSPRYIHIVVEFASGLYLHFGFGNLRKIGTWTGGSYHYPNHWTTGQANDPVNQWHSLGLDGFVSNNQLSPVLHAQGLTNQNADQRWLRFSRVATPAVDRASHPTGRVLGNGMRNGFMGEMPSAQRLTHETAFRSLIPVLAMHQHWDAPYHSGSFYNRWSPLGYWPDVAVVNMHGINPAEEITVGTDTWVVFPWRRKSWGGASGYPESRNAGLAYKKIT